MNCAILLAAGSGTRMGDLVEDKILFPLLEKPVINYSISAFTKTHKFSRFVIVYRDELQREAIAKILMPDFVKKYNPTFIKGGESRQASVFNALKEIETWNASIRFVAIHDTARPLIHSEFITELLASAEKHQNAIPATSMVDSIKSIESDSASDGESVKDLDRSKLRSVQTPQIFDFNLINESYQKVFESKHTITDDSSALAFSDAEINLVLNDRPNPKLTTKNDIDYILYLLNQKPLQ